MAIALMLHLLLAVVWVGGMFFAYVVLRPTAASQLEPPLRLALWKGVFGRFFPWVWAAVLLLPLTGYWMLFAAYGGFENAPWHVNVMQLTGLVMIGLFIVLVAGPWQGLQRKLVAGDLPGAAASLNRIRQIVATNLVLGLVTVAVASGGRLYTQ